MSTKDDPKIAARLRGISKSFGDGESRIKVLKGIDLDVAPGEVVVISDKDASWPDWDGKPLR